ncbi:hypothetical protein [Demequina sp. NBRC 110056]|uniref:hypothetical protein n=1 Tax=Demequina sp. NBRC 110056 TaxID=1570345 RepID=UPI000A0567A3|nr:hypothetical protein [Demequina sp. NBRC 110056]
MAFDHEGTEALQHLADEVEQERKTKGHTPFDDIPESEGEHSTREDAQGREASSDDEVTPAETIGYTGQPRTPGL